MGIKTIGRKIRLEGKYFYIIEVPPRVPSVHLRGRGIRKDNPASLTDPIEIANVKRMAPAPAPTTLPYCSESQMKTSDDESEG